MSDLKEWPFPPPPPRLLLAGDMVLWGMVGLVDEGIGSVYFKDSVGWERGVWGV